LNIQANFDGGIRTLTQGGSRAEGRGARIERIVRMRTQLREREEQIRKREDKLIERLSERMQEVVSNREMSSTMRTLTIQNFTNQIAMIHETRAKREEANAEKEATLTQLILDENTNPKNRTPREDEQNEDEEEAALRRERESIASMTRIAVGMDNLHALRRTRYTLVSEQGHLSRALDADTNFTKIGVVERGPADFEVIVSRHPMRVSGNWVYDQYNKLSAGIGRIDAAIQSGIAQMYQESTRTQELHLASHRHEGDESAKEYDYEI